ncbi:hypothetical protein WH8501_17000 [Crocosphaera watsonii WH 8501]|uniref:Uncharacterized protein n=1 Tax=Crocosphaera watsonii WH 8501 TaxID=165597 RepID=Q4BXL4_CROWT|nr:hypothetical protein CwatDRAFT_1241 [Crocosphaera watsonii WH 8501]
MLKIIMIFGLIVTNWTIMTSSAKAEFCRQINGQQICITKIKRSAKNYWEYRAAVKIDQETRPIEIYNCRQGHRITQEGEIIPFKSDGVGKLICRVLNK